MPDKEKTEKKLEDGVTVSYEMKPLEAASTEFYTIWSVEKVYIGVEFQVKTDTHRAGFNFIPTYGHEVRVGMVHKEGDNVVLPEGTLSKAAFDYQFTSLADSITMYRKRIISEAEPAKGF